MYLGGCFLTMHKALNNRIILGDETVSLIFNNCSVQLYASTCA